MADGEDAPNRASDNRKKYGSINVASIADLKAELYKKQQEFRQEKPKAPGTSAVQAKSASQKPNLWSKKNAGVQQRAASDLAAKIEEEDSLVKSRRVLEAKAKLYDKLAQSAAVAKNSDESSGGDDDDAESEGRYLVDFSRKLDDEWVDYVDSLGRSRRCLRRDLPGLISMDRSLSDAPAVSRARPMVDTGLPASGDAGGTAAQQQSGSDGPAAAAEPTLLSDDMRRELLRQKWEKEEQEARESNRDVHYANVRFDEIRDHGAGFYEFSKDEAVRAEEMRKLASMRQQTVHDRVHEEKLKQLRDEMLHVRLEAKRLQYLLRPGAASVGVPSDEARRKAEQQKIESLQLEAAGAASASDKLDLQVELKLRLEIASLRDAVLTSVSAAPAKSSSPGVLENGGMERLTSNPEADSGMDHEPSDESAADAAATRAAATASVEVRAAPPVPEAAAAARSDTVRQLQAAMQRLMKLQQTQLDKLQRSKKRGPDDSGGLVAAAVVGRDPAFGDRSAGAADDTFVGPLPRPSASVAGQVREWDVGKPGVITASAAAVPAKKKSWKEQVRSERLEEFAPPSSYGDEPTSARTAVPRRDRTAGRDVAGPRGSTASFAAPAEEQFASGPSADRVSAREPVSIAVHSFGGGVCQATPEIAGQPAAAAVQQQHVHGLLHLGVQQPPPPVLSGQTGSSWPWSGSGGSELAAEPLPPGVDAEELAANGMGAFYPAAHATSQLLAAGQQQGPPSSAESWPMAQWHATSRWHGAAAASRPPCPPHQPSALPPLVAHYDPSVPPPRLPVLQQAAHAPPSMDMATAYTVPPSPPASGMAYSMQQPAGSMMSFGNCSVQPPHGRTPAPSAAAAPSQPVGLAPSSGSMQASVEAMLRSLRSTARRTDMLSRGMPDDRKAHEID